MHFTPPPELRRKIAGLIAPRRPLAWLWNPAWAAAFALVLIVAVSVAVVQRRSAHEQTVAQLVDMHVAALASPNPVDVVSTDRHTVKPWFQGKLPFTFNLPELTGSGYNLVGGKVVYFAHKPAAQLIFSLRKHELSVFVLQDSPGSFHSPSSDNGFSVESWTSAGLHYVIVSDAGADSVHALANLLRAAQPQ